MVGRSKPRKLIEPKQSIDFNTTEITYLKAKNVDLAKALADSKAAYTLMVEDRDLLQRELFTMNLRCTKLENYIKNMESASRSLMNSVVISSNHATEILQNAHNALRLNIHDDNNIQKSIRTSFLNGSAKSSPVSNKTQTVNPMIAGHVILRPTINLRRVNEIPIEEIQRLQTEGEVRNTNRSSSESNSSSNSDNQAQDNNAATRVRIFRNRQEPVEEENQPFRNNEIEDEYTDQTSEISDAQSETNNGLDTVREEQEDDLTTENHLNSLPNSSTSLNLSGSSSQVPLLSGVFRDVRVYLSPMQNLSQYLDPRQHVTTERGSSKTHAAKISYGRHSSRPNEKSSGENRKPVATALNSPRNQTNSSATTTSSSSMEDSFSATLENSLLSSTRIGTPSRVHHTVTKPDDLNWLNNSTNSSSFDQSRSTVFSNRNSKHIEKNSLKRLSSRQSGSSKSAHSKNNKCSRPSTSDYDPLEGPSNMLDTFDEETKNKIETLGGLGLTPTFLENSQQAKPPSSPARTVVDRRERRKSDEKVKKSLYVTKRSSLEKKKGSIVSTKVAKVLIKRLSLGKSNSDSSRRSSSLDSSRRSLSDSKNQKSDNSNSTTTSRSRVSLLSVEKSSPKKRGRKSKVVLSVESRKKSVSPVVSPKKRGRPKRGTTKASLKEPSLRNKLRRSK